MSILDHEDIIFEEALRRSFINNAKAAIDSRSCAIIKNAGKRERELKIATEDYFVGEIVWDIDLSNFNHLRYFVLYVDKDGNPEWLKVD